MNTKGDRKKRESGGGLTLDAVITSSEKRAPSCMSCPSQELAPKSKLRSGGKSSRNYKKTQRDLRLRDTLNEKSPVARREEKSVQGTKWKRGRGEFRHRGIGGVGELWVGDVSACQGEEPQTLEKRNRGSFLNKFPLGRETEGRKSRRRPERCGSKSCSRTFN